MQTGQFSSAPDAVRLILSKEGAKGLFAVLVFSLYEGQASVMITWILQDLDIWNCLFCNLIMKPCLTLYCVTKFQSTQYHSNCLDYGMLPQTLFHPLFPYYPFVQLSTKQTRMNVQSICALNELLVKGTC